MVELLVSGVLGESAPLGSVMTFKVCRKIQKTSLVTLLTSLHHTR